MKKAHLVLILVSLQIVFAQFHHGISYQRTNKGNSINYTLSALATLDIKYAFRTGIHIESPESGFTIDDYNNLIEIPVKQISYLPVSAELNYTFFRDSMENSFLPLGCLEIGTITGLGKIKDTFNHHYRFHYFWAAGFGAEFASNMQKYQISLRYFRSENLDGNIMIDFTFFWK